MAWRPASRQFAGSQDKKEDSKTSRKVEKGLQFKMRRPAVQLQYERTENKFEM